LATEGAVLRRENSMSTDGVRAVVWPTAVLGQTESSKTAMAFQPAGARTRREAMECLPTLQIWRVSYRSTPRTCPCYFTATRQATALRDMRRRIERSGCVLYDASTLVKRLTCGALADTPPRLSRHGQPFAIAVVMKWFRWQSRPGLIAARTILVRR
jgi:hypothetical protein